MPYNPNTHTNTGTTTVVDIANSSFSGTIVNTGTISPNGIVITDSSIAGGIQDIGEIVGGISLDRNTTLNATNSAGIQINATNFHGVTIAFAGGITNAGVISNSGNNSDQVGAGDGILVIPAPFEGGIINSAGGIITGAERAL
jgi:hypothetical protein